MKSKLILSKLRFSFVLFTLVAFVANAEQNSHKKEINQWQQERYDDLKQDDGWLSLTGLFWLTEGVNGIGSEIDNKIILPKGKAAEYLGSYVLREGKITANFPPNSAVFDGDKAVQKQPIATDIKQQATTLSHGTLSWYVIEREGRFGVRVRDSALPQSKSLATLKYFETNPSWIVKAKFSAYQTQKKLQVPTVMDWYWQATSPGTVTFTVDGQQHTLDIIDSGDQYFILFGDKTNGKQTYGAGRFLYIDKPEIDKANEADKAAPNPVTVLNIDFNKAHNPPCVFTPFATCPLPPPQNNLALAVTAGEMGFHF